MSEACELKENGSRWLMMSRTICQPKLKLFCFPFAGGGASVFRLWMRLLPPEMQVCAVQLPGRESRIRERAFNQMQPLVLAATEALIPYLDGPYAFFGHSMGAILAFEIARRLRILGKRGPNLLIPSASCAPQIPRKLPVTFNLPEDKLVLELRELQGTHAEVLEHREIMQVLLPLLRSDFEAIETYSYQEGQPLECPIFSIGGAEDADIGIEDLNAWRVQTSGEFSACVLPGNHFFLLNDHELVVQTILEHLQKSMSAIK